MSKVVKSRRNVAAYFVSGVELSLVVFLGQFIASRDKNQWLVLVKSRPRCIACRVAGHGSRYCTVPPDL